MHTVRICSLVKSTKSCTKVADWWAALKAVRSLCRGPEDSRLNGVAGHCLGLLMVDNCAGLLTVDGCTGLLVVDDCAGLLVVDDCAGLLVVDDCAGLLVVDN